MQQPPAPAMQPVQPGQPAPEPTPPPTPPPTDTADQAAKEEPKTTDESSTAQVGLGAQNPFRTSSFIWTLNASTQTLGVGQDYIGSEGEVVSMEFSFNPRFSFINSKTNWAWAGLNIPWSVELTNSDVTSKRQQVLFGDMQIQTAYNRTFYRGKEGLSFLGGPRFSVGLPTSLVSQNNGTYARTVLGLGLISNVPFHSGDAFNGVFFSAATNWQHLFSEANVPVYEDLRLPRQTGTGQTLQSDILSGIPFVRNQITASLSYWLTIVGDLSFGNTWGIQVPFRDEQIVTDCDVYIENEGCKSIMPSADASNATPATVFDVSLNYTVANLVQLGLGYNNTTSQLGPDGRRRSMFYSPDAQFYLSAFVFLDSIYSKVAPKQEPKKSALAASALGL